MQVVLVLETLVAIVTVVVAPVAVAVHVLLDAGKCVIPLIAGFALVPGTIVSFVLLVIFKVFRVVEGKIAKVALEYVADCVHVLSGRGPAAESSVALPAFGIHLEARQYELAVAPLDGLRMRTL